MKYNMKRILYGLIFLFVGTFTVFAQSDVKLKFNNDGEFKIVQFTDTHINFKKESNLNVYQIVEEVINIEKPDFVIFTGDNVTESEPQKAYKLLEELFAEANVPWAAVFGNHDGQSGVTRKDIADFLSKLPHCMNRDFDKDEVYGYSNFILPVYGKSKKIEALLYCMDSNSNSTLSPTVGGYGWFDYSQINWYRKKSKEFTLTNNGNPLPALAFFHIPLPEYTQAWNNKINPPLGVKNEDECSPDINTGMFSAMLECGDVMGTFVGHDHINDYIGIYYNIALAYGRVSKVMRNPEEDPLAGGRVIVLTEGQRKFDTWIRDMDGKRELDYSWPESITKREIQK
jgi:hypothetical protein